MEKRVLKKPTLVLMAGLPGVGKTTLANKLGKRLRWYVLDRDTIKDSWQEDTLIRESVSEMIAGRAAYETFFKMAEDMLVHQRLSVILDSSTLYPFIVERTLELAKQTNAHLKIIHCIVDEKTRQSRLFSRTTRKSQVNSHLVPAEANQHIEQNLKILPFKTLKLHTEDGQLDAYTQEAVEYLIGTPKHKSNRASAKARIKYKLVHITPPKPSRSDLVFS